MAGLEYSFLNEWEGWDIVGNEGDLYFYKVKLLPEFEYLIPKGIFEIGLGFFMSESYVQFDFYDKDQEVIGSRAFKIKSVLLEEIDSDI